MSQIPFLFKPGKPGKPGSVTVILDNKPCVLFDTAVNFNAVIAALKGGAWSKVRALFDVKQAIAAFTSGRVSIVGSELIVDGKPLHDALSKRVMEIFNSGGDIKPLVNFLNNIQENPLESARAELYLFLDACDLPITEDGCFLAYKMIRQDYTDCYTGTMDNSVGATPEMKREDCNPNRDETCSRGLHFCSRSYIGAVFNDYRLVVLKINPRDVVSIPVDYGNAKGRACKYDVIEEIETDQLIKPNFRTTDGSVPERSPVQESLVKPTAADNKANAVKGKSVKLTEKDVLGIRKMLAEGFKYPVIGAKYGVHRRTIERIDKNEAWSSVQLPKVAKRKR